MPQIVFLTLYLGLVSGRQPISVRPDPGIVSVRMTLNGAPFATLTSPPWRATADFGKGLLPQELIVIGYDKDGAEVARASQAINVPRPMAEADVTIEGHTIKVSWRHRMNETPRRAWMSIDDKPVALRDFHAPLPGLDMSLPHILKAKVTFENGSAEIERVIGGMLPDATGTELTATGVRQTGAIPSSLDGCFSFDGRALDARPAEKPEALVILVRNPNPVASLMAMGKDPGMRSTMMARAGRDFANLAPDTSVRVLWPVAQKYTGTDVPTSQLFAHSGDFDAQSGGMLKHLALEGRGRQEGESSTLRFADAVAVAGVQAADGARRRAVILILDGLHDYSRMEAPTVRRYLAAIGVPLFVWSVLGPQPELELAWGTIVDISSPDRLVKATEAVKRELESQRIVWLGADPVHALRASLKPSCGLTMLAQR